MNFFDSLSTSKITQHVIERESGEVCHTGLFMLVKESAAYIRRGRPQITNGRPTSALQ